MHQMHLFDFDLKICLGQVCDKTNFEVIFEFSLLSICKIAFEEMSHEIAELNGSNSTF